jgi:hypothetical protein
MARSVAFAHHRPGTTHRERSSMCEQSEPRPRAPEGRKIIARGKRGTGRTLQRFIPSPPGRTTFREAVFQFGASISWRAWEATGVGERRASEPPQDEPSGFTSPQKKI